LLLFYYLKSDKRVATQEAQQFNLQYTNSRGRIAVFDFSFFQ